MNIGIFGTGMVGNTLATKLVSLGHSVCMGSRTADNEKATQWAAKANAGASHGTFADAASHGEILFNCTSGGHSLAALEAAGAANLAGKVLVDVANPLDFSKGMPPTLSICNDDSLGETIQRAFPEARVVKTLNTINCQVMVEPSRIPGDHDLFISGNDAAAKSQVKQLLASFGWERIIDLGDISTARGTESYLPLWVRMMQAFGTADFNISVRKAQ